LLKKREKVNAGAGNATAYSEGKRELSWKHEGSGQNPPLKERMRCLNGTEGIERREYNL
jgi:hypothetical protein